MASYPFLNLGRGRKQDRKFCSFQCVQKFQAFNRSSGPRPSSSRMEEIYLFSLGKFCCSTFRSIFFFKKKSIIFIYLVRCGILLVYLSALKFPTGTNTNPFSWLKRRGNWLTQTQLESHISSLLSHLVPCFKLTKAGSKSPAVQVDSPILIHFFNIQF